jgi:hypothetical protein
MGAAGSVEVKAESFSGVGLSSASAPAAPTATTNLESIWEAESARPLDASDIDDASAKQEITRLRALLKASLDASRSATFLPAPLKDTSSAPAAASLGETKGDDATFDVASGSSGHAINSLNSTCQGDISLFQPGAIKVGIRCRNFTSDDKLAVILRQLHPAKAEVEVLHYAGKRRASIRRANSRSDNMTPAATPGKAFIIVITCGGRAFIPTHRRSSGQSTRAHNKEACNLRVLLSDLPPFLSAPAALSSALACSEEK